jgi:hypothetical protein
MNKGENDMEKMEKLFLNHVDDSDGGEGFFSITNDQAEVLAVIPELTEAKKASKKFANILLKANELFEYCLMLSARVQPLMDATEDQLTIHLLQRIKNTVDSVERA